MISKLQGTLVEESILGGWISVFLSNGIGYRVNYVNKRFLYSVNDQVSFHTVQLFREDNQTLWGFDFIIERILFEHLIGISGVGGKSAQAIISNLGVKACLSAILNQSHSGLKVPGVGEKTAKKIIIELSGKLDYLFTQLQQDIEFIAYEGEYAVDRSGGTGLSSVSTRFESDLIEALINLGFAKKQIQLTVDKLNFKDISIEEAVKLTLRELKRT